ncbi:MAG: response regulator transcription factor [Acidobacteriia bacterium]|nr:response regulator transcription factor [Terriglobia bacterium]
MKQARILLADDHSLVIGGIRGLLESRYEIVGSADNGKSLIEAALRLAPELVILDVSMPILNGIDAAREIRRVLPDTKFVFLSMHSNPLYLRKALEVGAAAYVLKSGASEELLGALEAVKKGETYISAGFDRQVLDELRDSPRKSGRSVIELTARQRQILQLIAEGKQNKEIAEILHASIKTVEFHRSRLMSKLGAHTVAELTRLAIEEGVITIRQ